MIKRHDLIKTEVESAENGIAEDSKLYWKEDGYLYFGTVKELYDHVSKDKNIDVLGLMRINKNNALKDYTPSFLKMESCIYYGLKDVWRIKINSGRYIDTTKNFLLLTTRNRSRKDRLYSEPLNNLKEVLTGNLLIQGEKLSVENDFLILIGLWIADGSWLKSNGYLKGVRIASGNNPEIISFLNTIRDKYSVHSIKRYRISEFIKKSPKADFEEVNNRFGCSHSEYWRIKKKVENNESFRKFTKGSTIVDQNYIFNSTKFANQLKSFGLKKYWQSHSKRVSPQIFTSSIKNRCSFLKGYFSGDGSAFFSKDNIIVSATSVNKSLLQDIQALLSSLGIESSIREAKAKEGDYRHPNKYYIISIRRRRSVKEFYSKIGFIKKVPECSRDSQVRDTKENNNSYIFRKVQKIEYAGRKPVYNIVVQATGIFIANGIFCHGLEEPNIEIEEI